MNQLTRSVEIKMRHLKSFNFAIALSRSFCPWFPVKMLNQNSINYCWPEYSNFLTMLTLSANSRFHNVEH